MKIFKNRIQSAGAKPTGFSRLRLSREATWQVMIGRNTSTVAFDSPVGLASSSRLWPSRQGSSRPRRRRQAVQSAAAWLTGARPPTLARPLLSFLLFSPSLPCFSFSTSPVSSPSSSSCSLSHFSLCLSQPPVDLLAGPSIFASNPQKE